MTLGLGPADGVRGRLGIDLPGNRVQYTDTHFYMAS